MINSLEEANTHVQNNAYRVSNSFKHIVVLEDGTIHKSNDEEHTQSVIDDNDCFVVKVDLKKEVKHEE